MSKIINIPKINKQLVKLSKSDNIKLSNEQKQLKIKYKEILMLPDKFNQYFSSNCWIAHNYFDDNIMKEAISIYERNKNIEEVDIYLSNEYNENTIGQYKNLVDYIVANPPYGLKDYGYDFAINSGEDRWEYGIPNKGDGDIAFLLTINDLLTSTGKAGVILPLGTLFKDSTSKIRENLLTNDLVEGIVMLPSNMFQTTSIPVCFWILNKNKQEQDRNKVFMVNGFEEYIKVGKFNEFQKERCLHNYLNRIEEEGLSGYVSIQDIEENDWNLSVQRYVFKDEPEEVIDIVELNKDIINLNNDIITKSNDMNFILSQILKLGI